MIFDEIFDNSCDPVSLDDIQINLFHISLNLIYFGLPFSRWNLPFRHKNGFIPTGEFLSGDLFDLLFNFIFFLISLGVSMSNDYLYSPDWLILLVDNIIDRWRCWTCRISSFLIDDSFLKWIDISRLFLTIFDVFFNFHS